MFALTFTDPVQLCWLLLLPVLWWLALPPRPRVTLWTAHLPQWQQAHRVLRRRPPRLSGLRYALIATACLAAVAAGAGLAEPGAVGPTRLVVVLDGSASMNAKDASGAPAFAAATAALRARFATLPEHVDVTLLRCGGTLLRRHGASARALHDLGAPGGALDADLAEVGQRLASADTAVWTLTDGQGQRSLPAAGALSVFGAPAANAAVLAVRTVDHWPLPQFEVEADVVLFADGPRPGTVSLAGAVAQAPEQAIELQPGVPATVRWPLQRTAAGGPLELRIAVAGDALPDDDSWRAVLPPLPAPRIAWLADADAGLFAEVAAKTLADEVSGSVVTAAPGVEVGLLLVDGGTVAVEPGRMRALCFGARPAGAPEPAPWLRPQVADWDRSSPLTAGLDLSELRIECAFRETLPPGVPFLWAATAAGAREPLAVVCGDEKLASVHFAFRLRDSNLPLLPACPQLLRRAFVRTYGAAATLGEVTPAPAPGEQDLQTRATGPDRALGPFGSPARSLAPWCLLLGLLALAVRTLVR